MLQFMNKTNVFGAVQNSASSSSRISNFTKRFAVLTLLLLTVVLGARAQSVIMSGDYFLTHNIEGTSVNAAGTTTFNPATCLWQFAQDNYIRPADNNGSAITSNNNYLQYTSLTLGNDGFNWYRARSNENIYHRTGNLIRTYYYLRLNGTNWQISNNNSNNGKLIQVTITQVSTTSTNPTINGNAVLTATGNYTYTASGAAYQAGGYVNYRFNNTDHYFDNNNTDITPKAATLNGTAWSISANEYATINSSGIVTVNRIPTSDVTLIITAIVSVTGGTPAAPAGTTLVGTKEITIQGSVPAAPTISVSGTTVTLQTDATGTTSIRYTIDGTDPTVTTGTEYNGAFDISGSTNSPVTIKAITVRNGNASSVTTQQAKLTLPEPVITVNAATGTATITCSNSSATIYYTTDGSTPSATNGTPYNGQITGLATMATVKAIAICDGWNSSSVASATVTIPSGVSGGTVTLFDYEDHKWSYYSDEECPIHSLNPADVKITYYGNGTKTVTSATEAVENPTSFSLDATTVKVGPNDDANVFVYYKTLERENVDGTGNVPYTTIPNPFLVRPTGNSGSAPATVSITIEGYGSNNNATGSVSCTYYNASGDQKSESINISGTTARTVTITVKTGTDITFTLTRTSNNRTVSFRAYYTEGGREFASGSRNQNGIQNFGPFTISASSDANNYRGFYAWRVKSKSEGLSITDVNGNSFANNIIPAETEIRFVTSNEYGNEVEFEALWAQAYVTDGTSDLSTRSNSYERNFHVVKSETSASSFQKSYPLTVTSYYPDGTSAGGSVTGGFTAAADTKFENITISNATNSTWTANGHDLIVGRGCTGTVGTMRGLSSGTSGDIKYVIRLESGTFGTFNMIDGTTRTHSGTVSAKTIFGCDYDRANKDNDKLSISANSTVYGADEYQSFSGGANRNNLTYDWLIKSGKVQSSKSVADAAAENCIYMGNSGSTQNTDGNQYQGKRRLIMEGGEVCNIAGGLNNYGNNRDNYIVNDGGWTLQIRLKGGVVRGSVFGAAAFAGASGDRLFIFTGGTIGGWVAGGANGTQNTGGELYGSTSLYMGGKTVIGSESGGTHVGGTSSYGTNGADGGNVFGAGCGILPANGNYQTGTVGRVNNSIVAVADEATIWRDVYGGGNYGWVRDNGTTGIYILGGMVNGSVYGGSNNQQGQEVVITMKGGVIKGNTIGDATKTGGLYGGSNSWGTINNNVTMQINGGQVGTSSKSANIHGGGYGQNTTVSGNVDITLGADGQTTGGVTVYGDVYGGSALGTVNSDANDHTYVTMYKGTINGSLYGGGLGSASLAANVNGPVKVEVHGGSVKTTDGTGENGSGGVYGANNINGAPQSSVTVDIYGTDPAPAEGKYALYAVYGGGNQADYLYGNGYPTVTVHGCDNSIEYVYGGGNAAAVKSTNVTIWGGNVIGNVFGGGHGYKDGAGADVEGDVNLAIKGGTIKRVFGGSNSKGNISGTINLDINKDGACDMRIGEVYGGGNEADGNAGAVTIGCTGALVEGDEGHAAHPENIGKTLEGIGAVYGGANNANVTNASGITLNINSGMVANVFGGNNTGGGINGTITVNVNKNEETCGWYVGNVFGGGNLAQYSGAPAVNILNGEVSGNVYGGGKGDANDHSKGQVTGNPTVTIGDKSNAGYEAIVKGDVYGGGDAGNVVGTPIVNVVNKCNTTIGNVYGGGNAADVNGTDVNIDGGTITGMVFGGGHGDKNADPQTEANVNGNVNVDITGGTINKVFGGSNSKGNITGTIALNIEKGDESCELHITEVYGGGNEAAGNAGTINIACTGGEGEGIGDVYGGANAADINTPITLNITGGNIKRVFGGNNTSGSINGDIQVNVDWSGTCGINALGNVYGAGNQAAYSGNTEVNILNGTVTGSVYGGGLGATAVVTGTTKVNIDGSADGHSVMVTQNVLGGGDAAAVEGSTDVNIINGAVSGSVFGGGNAAGVSENGVVDITGGTIASGVYGGSNASGAVGNTIVTLTYGIIGTDAAHANVHGGGYGKDTQVSGNVAVNIQGGTVYGDVYGGSALGTVNTDTDNTTIVNLTGGIIHGDAYGGGLGDSETAADVNGNVTVTLDGTAFVLATTTDDKGNSIPTSGRIFGCNNINGSPKGTVLVKVLSTVAKNGDGTIKDKPEKDSGIYELQAVYGGGNLAAYNPTNSKATGQYTYRFNSDTYGEVNFTAVEKPVQVVIDGCELTSIEYVYGGGNAAATPATDVLVLGSYEIGNVFGGGNGKDRYTLDGGTTWNENLGADVGIIDAVAYAADHTQGLYGTGKSKASVLGGTVHNLFGASNTKGNVVSESLAYVDNANICDLNVGGIYGGGNEAYMDGDSKIELGCIEAMEEIYGGARNADVKGDINLTISSGHFDRVFGGNNIGGTINGSITVTIEETGCNPITIGELYGCGNQAPYTTPEGKHDPIINLISFTSIGNVFGGGLGASAVVTGNPTVNINVEDGDHVNVEYKEKTIVFGNDYKVTLPLHKTGEIGAIGTVYGGGNAAAVIGNTTVNMTKGIVENTVFGGGNAADVEGDTSVTILDGTIGGNVYGGGNQGDVTGETKVQIGKNPLLNI